MFFFFSLFHLFPLRVRRQTALGREWVRSSCGDGALTGVSMDAAHALMQVSWIVKGPPVGPTGSRTFPLFFFSRSFFLRRPVPSVSLRAVSPPSPLLPPTPCAVPYSDPNRCLAATVTRVGTRSSHLNLPFMPGTLPCSAVATLGPRMSE